MRTLTRTMGTVTNIVFVALTLALTAAPAAAIQRERDEGFRGWHREEWQVTERRDNREAQVPREHRQWKHQRWEDRHFSFVSPVPYAAPNCFTRPGYWAWDGWQHLWVPPQTVCR